jgi:Double zinc ribbon
MLTLAYFGIESSGLNLVIDLLIVFLVVLYLSLIYWTYTDARRRIADPMLVGCSTAASLFPYVGTIIYMIVRPPEYLEDVHERELEIQAAEARLFELDSALCPHCDYRIERDFIRCPSCLRKLKERCVSCSRPLDQAWTICPYCETEVPGVVSSRRTRRRRTPPVESDRAEIVDTAARPPERGGGGVGHSARPSPSERAPAGSAGAAGSQKPGSGPVLDDSLSEADPPGVGQPTEEDNAVRAAPVIAPESAAGALGAERPPARAGRPGGRPRSTS